MAQTVTLELPDTIYQPAQRMAAATRRSITEVLVSALKTFLPPLEGLSTELQAELTVLEELDDKTLWSVMLSQVPEKQQRKLSDLLQKKKIGKLTEPEQATLSTLQSEADRMMLRKARAAVLLRFRGHHLPALAELRQANQTPSK